MIVTLDKLRSAAKAIWLLLLVLAVMCTAVVAGTDEDDCGAVYELKKWHYILKGDKAVLQGEWRVRILNRRGAEYAVLSLSESPFVRLKKVRAVRIGNDGTEEIVLNKKDLTKSCGFGSYQVYSDNCSYYADLSSRRYPYTIVVEYVKELKSLFGLRGALFQSDIPVLHAEYTLLIDTDVPYRYRMIGTDLEPTISTVKGKEQLVWTLDSIPGRVEYDYIPSWENPPIHLKICVDRFSMGKVDYEGSSWESIGQWYAELCGDRSLKPDGVIPSLEPANARALVDSIYTEVQDAIRYVAISIGIGGWQPHTADFTIENGYGDCKDMTNLLTSRLRNVGIQAYPALILTRDDGRTDPTFPGFNFNHVITMVVLRGGDTLWYDPTCSQCPPGMIPYNDEETMVLVASETGGRLYQTPTAQYDQNVTERISRWTISADLSASYECEVHAGGQYGRWLRSALGGLDADEERRLIENQFRSAGKKYTIDAYSVEQLEEIDQPVIIKVNGQTTRPARKLRGAVYFDPLILASVGSISQTDIEERPYSLNKYYPDLVVDRATVVWDAVDGVDSIGLPDTDSLAYSFGHLAISSQTYADSAVISLSRADYNYLIDTSLFGEFKQYQSDAREVYDSHLKLFVP